MKRYFSVIFVLFLNNFVNSNISVKGPKCGQTMCRIDEYCFNIHLSCEPCAPICDESNHNFDQTICEKQCQDYLHNFRYLSKDGSGLGEENLKATVQKLSSMITVTLTLVCLMLIVLAGVFFFQLYRWKQKKNITLSNIREKLFSKKSENNTTKPTTTPTNQNNEKPELRLEMPPMSTHSDNSPVTVTTSISRRPAEDSTLDYAYDNPAMNTSPDRKSVPVTF